MSICTVKQAMDRASVPRPPKPKKCKNCLGTYTPEPFARPFECWCSPPCGIAIARKKQAAARERKRREQEREHRIRKEAIKPRSKWLQEAQAAFNSYIRARDSGKPCISSGAYEQERFTGGHFDAGHYRSTGAAAHLRFNTWNCHAQSKHDNRDLSGNLVAYRLRLIERIGLERVEQLERNNETRSFDIEYLRRVKRIFTKRAKHLKKLRGYQ